MKILVIDDSKTMRNIIKSVLSQLGYTDVVEACDGLDALSRLGAVMPTLILVDWNMPNMDGLTFVKECRNRQIKTPIVMVTTEAEKSRVIEAIKAGINNYVVKPFTPDVLKDCITSTVQKVAA